MKNNEHLSPEENLFLTKAETISQAILATENDSLSLESLLELLKSQKDNLKFLNGVNFGYFQDTFLNAFLLKDITENTPLEIFNKMKDLNIAIDDTVTDDLTEDSDSELDSDDDSIESFDISKLPELRRKFELERSLADRIADKKRNQELYDEIFDILLGLNDDINQSHEYYGFNALHCAVKSNNVHATKRILEETDIDVHTGIIMEYPDITPQRDADDRYGYSALHLACCEGNGEIVKMILDSPKFMESIAPNKANVLEMYEESDIKSPYQIALDLQDSHIIALLENVGFSKLNTQTHDSHTDSTTDDSNVDVTNVTKSGDDELTKSVYKVLTQQGQFHKNPEAFFAKKMLKINSTNHDGFVDLFRYAQSRYSETTIWSYEYCEPEELEKTLSQADNFFTTILKNNDGHINDHTAIPLLESLCRFGHVAAATYIIEKKADLFNTRNEAGQHCIIHYLDIAADNNQDHLVSALLDLDVLDYNSTDLENAFDTVVKNCKYEAAAIIAQKPKSTITRHHLDTIDRNGVGGIEFEQLSDILSKQR